MRIAFDLDETLIPYGDEFPVERSVPLRPLRLFYRERLRLGTIALLRRLSRAGFEIWIYTTSLRGAWYLKTWFLWWGIRIRGVVNTDIHNRRMRARPHFYPDCEKYPPAFGIELLIDNSEGIALEGREYGFEVLRIDPADRDWCERIVSHLRALRTIE